MTLEQATARVEQMRAAMIREAESLEDAAHEISGVLGPAVMRDAAQRLRKNAE